MTDTEIYERGYEDGKSQRPQDKSLSDDPNYELGYTDGMGDTEIEGVAQAIRPVADEYEEMNSPPRGFAWAGIKATPAPGQWYLTKNGNAKLAEKVRGNAQTRHILKPLHQHAGHKYAQYNHEGSFYCHDCMQVFHWKGV